MSKSRVCFSSPCAGCLPRPSPSGLVLYTCRLCHIHGCAPSFSQYDSLIHHLEAEHQISEKLTPDFFYSCERRQYHSLAFPDKSLLTLIDVQLYDSYPKTAFELYMKMDTHDDLFVDLDKPRSSFPGMSFMPMNSEPIPVYCSLVDVLKPFFISDQHLPVQANLDTVVNPSIIETAFAQGLALLKELKGYGNEGSSNSLTSNGISVLSNLTTIILQSPSDVYFRHLLLCQHLFVELEKRNSPWTHITMDKKSLEVMGQMGSEYSLNIWKQEFKPKNQPYETLIQNYVHDHPHMDLIKEFLAISKAIDTWDKSLATIFNTAPECKEKYTKFFETFHVCTHTSLQLIAFMYFELTCSLWALLSPNLSTADHHECLALCAHICQRLLSIVSVCRF